MTFKASYIPYRQTGAFSKIIEDYLTDEPGLRDFYAYRPDMNGIKKALEARKDHEYNRVILSAELHKQYEGTGTSARVKANIEALLKPNTFTVTTAHQPNIFTGHLYFIYKIIHAIKLADELNEAFGDYHFVPVYYMGSEDADLQELGEVFINGKKYEWKTAQQGAVGRMKIDKPFIEMIIGIEGQLSVEPYGNEIISLVKECYVLGASIETSTFKFVDALFKDQGLVIFLPDNAVLKNGFNAIIKKELTGQFSRKAVDETIAAFPDSYKVQAAGRDINLFYLKDDTRERIEKTGNGFLIAGTNIRFTQEEIFKELEEHPERFSANVILRPVFQEMILPNIVFIGGGGELAYWLELKNVFRDAAIPFPVLVLRNSFMIVKRNTKALMEKLKLTSPDLFKSKKALIEELVKRDSQVVLQLTEEMEMIRNFYNQVRQIATAVDRTLERHTEALSVQAVNKILELEKKMLRAEKKKFDASQRQIHKIKSVLFPEDILQERIDNLMPFYAIWGSSFLKLLYENSNGLNQEFCMLEEQ